MNVAFFVGSDVHTGGGFQYEAKVAQMLSQNDRNGFKAHFFTMDRCVAAAYKNIGIEAVCLDEGLIAKIHRRLLRNCSIYKLLKKCRLSKAKIVSVLEKKYGIDLVYFLSPSMFALDLINIPYIVTVWDLCHRDFNDFPEVRDDREFEMREDLYQRTLKKAIAVVADSDMGKSNIVRRYGVDEGRVHVLKFLPNPIDPDNGSPINVKAKYNLDNDYVFYPAQFWPHKNHIYILKAMKILKEKYSIKIEAVFSGSEKGNMDYILKRANEYGIGDQVHCIGFVDEQEMPYLYHQALALVMPTYFGPTNIPPLEAFAYSTPVCYSDLPGLRDQVGNAAFLLDLSSPETLAQHIITIRSDKSVVNNKIQEGKKILEGWTDGLFYNNLIELLNKYRQFKECWAYIE